MSKGSRRRDNFRAFNNAPYWGRDIDIDGKNAKRLPDCGAEPHASTNLDRSRSDTPDSPSKKRNAGVTEPSTGTVV